MTDITGIINDPDRMNKELTSLTEEQLQGLINYEISSKCRRTMIIRLHKRYAKLHTKRVREALIKGDTLL